MSMRRNTGRDRRGGGTTPLPTIAQFYSAGIKIHLDAALGVTSTASRVSAWADQSGNSNNLLQATGANQPLLVLAATPGGTPAIRTDSTARTMSKNSGATNHANAAYTLFLVVKQVAASQTWRHSNGTASNGLDYNPTGGNRRISSLGSTTLVDGAHSTANFEVICWRLAAAGGYGTAMTTKEVYVNGVLQAAPTGTPNMTQGTGVLIIGSAGSSGDVSYAEIAAAPQTLLSAADCIALSRGLMRKHSIT